MAPMTDSSASRLWGGPALEGPRGAVASTVAIAARCCHAHRSAPVGFPQSARVSLRSYDHGLHRRGHPVGDLDDDHVGADVADRLVEVDLAAVHLDAAGVADRVDDVLRRDR